MIRHCGGQRGSCVCPLAAVLHVSAVRMRAPRQLDLCVLIKGSHRCCSFGLLIAAARETLTESMQLNKPGSYLIDHDCKTLKYTFDEIDLINAEQFVCIMAHSVYSYLYYFSLFHPV